MMGTTLRLRRTAGAKLERAVGAIRQLHETTFSGKRMGRFVITRDQLKRLLDVKNLHDNTFFDFQALALQDEDLVVSELTADLYGVVSATKAVKWRKVPRAILGDILAEPHDEGEILGLAEQEDEDD